MIKGRYLYVYNRPFHINQLNTNKHYKGVKKMRKIIARIWHICLYCRGTINTDDSCLEVLPRIHYAHEDCWDNKGFERIIREKLALIKLNTKQTL